MIDVLIDTIWINRLIDYKVLYVGFSGGLDSTVLLHALASHPVLTTKIHAVHINHGLSQHAFEWQQHSQVICDALSIPLSIYSVHINQKTNVEEQARDARYAVFRSLLKPNDALLLAHHEDDEAETVLLHLMRGAGIDGLAAMQPVQQLSWGTVLRPLLSLSRQHLEAYASTHSLTWVEDSSNVDENFSRNFLRHSVIPVLKQKWPAAVQNIARAASHCREAKQNLDALAKMDCRALMNRPNPLVMQEIKTLPRERLVNVLRVWLRQNQAEQPSAKTLYRLIDELIFARVDADPMITFGGVVIRRYREALYCYHSMPETLVRKTVIWSGFPAPLVLGERLGTLYFTHSTNGFCVPHGCCIQVRFRQGGESFRICGQTKSLKKLLQEWHVPPWMRDSVPLIYVDDVLSAVVGYAVSDYFYGNQPICLSRTTSSSGPLERGDGVSVGVFLVVKNEKIDDFLGEAFTSV